METFLAFGIVAFFTTWVCNLKREIYTLEERVTVLKTDRKKKGPAAATHATWESPDDTKMGEGPCWDIGEHVPRDRSRTSSPLRNSAGSSFPNARML